MKKIILILVLFFNLLPCIKKGKLLVLNITTAAAEGFGDEGDDGEEDDAKQTKTINPSWTVASYLTIKFNSYEDAGEEKADYKSPWRFTSFTHNGITLEGVAILFNISIVTSWATTSFSSSSAHVDATVNYSVAAPYPPYASSYTRISSNQDFSPQ